MDELVQSSTTFTDVPSMSRWNTGRYLAVRVRLDVTGAEKSHFSVRLNHPRNALPSTAGAEIIVTELPEGTWTERRVPESATNVTVTDVPSPPITLCSHTANRVSVLVLCPALRVKSILSPGEYTAEP